jgi:hypothetical protein
MGLARIEVAAHGHGPGAVTGLHQVGPGQRTRLLQQQCDQDGKKAHCFIIAALFVGSLQLLSQAAKKR